MSMPSTGSAEPAASSPLLRSLLKVDIFRVVQDRDQHLTPATSRGGWISAVCVVLIALGVANESWLFFRQDWRSTMAVSKHALQMEECHFNITFDNYPCAALEFEAIEASTGRIYEEQQATAKIEKFRLVNGVNIGAHAASSQQQQALPQGGVAENGEGCLFTGSFMLDKVPGHFSIIPRNLGGSRPPTDFTIHGLWFGEKRIATRDIAEGLANALGGFRSDPGQPVGTLYQFFLNIVPTSFDDGRIGFEYTATHSHVQADIPAGLYFHHVHSPLSVMYHRATTTWAHYLTNLCAVVGGVFTVVGFGAAAANKVSKLFDREGSA
jgi:hypothetical protein